MKARTRRFGILAAVLPSMALLQSCVIWGTPQLGVSAGKGLYVRIYQRPTDQIEVLYQLENRSARATLKFMETQVVFSDDIKGKIAAVGYKVADVDYFFDPVQAADFSEALAGVRNSNKCLMMHRNPANYWPGADRHNWTTSTPPGECILGQPYKV